VRLKQPTMSYKFIFPALCVSSHVFILFMRQFVSCEVNLSVQQSYQRLCVFSRNL